MNSLLYILRRKDRPLVRLATGLTIAGIAFAVFALNLGFSIIAGFEKAYLKSVLSFNAPLVLVKDGGIADRQLEEESLRRSLEESAPQEKSVPTTSFLYKEAILVSGQTIKGVVVKGLSQDRLAQASLAQGEAALDINYFDSKTGEVQWKKGQGILMGSALAEILGITEGLKVSVSLFFPSDGIDWEQSRLAASQFHRVPVLGTFHSGMYQYDEGFVFLSLSGFDSILGKVVLPEGLEVWLSDPSQAAAVADSLRQKFDFPYSVMSWLDINYDIFRMLSLHKLIFGILLGFLILVACFNLTGVLVMKMLERRRDIAIMKTCGATPGQLRSLFLLEACLLGGLGVLLGLLLSYGASFLLSSQRLLHLAPEVYFISAVPSFWSWRQVLIVSLVAFVFVAGAALVALGRLGKLQLVKILSEG